MLVFCPLACEGILPLTRCHECESGLTTEDDGVQVNVTLFDTLTVELIGLALIPKINHTVYSYTNVNV